MLGMKNKKENTKPYQGRLESLYSILFDRSDNSSYLIEDAVNLLVDILGDVDLTVIKVSSQHATDLASTILNPDALEELLEMVDYYLVSEKGKLRKSIKVAQRPNVIETRVIPISNNSIVKTYLLIDIYDMENLTDLSELKEVFNVFSTIVCLVTLEQEVHEAYERDVLTHLKTRDSLVRYLDNIIETVTAREKEDTYLVTVHLKNVADLNTKSNDGYEKVDRYIREVGSALGNKYKGKAYRLCGVTFAFVLFESLENACAKATSLIDELHLISEELDISIMVGKLMDDGVSTVFNCERNIKKVGANEIVYNSNNLTPSEEKAFNSKVASLQLLMSKDVKVMDEKRTSTRPDTELDTVEHLSGEVIDSEDDIKDENNYTQMSFSFEETDEEDDFGNSGEGLSFDDED